MGRNCLFEIIYLHFSFTFLKILETSSKHTSNNQVLWNGKYWSEKTLVIQLDAYKIGIPKMLIMMHH